MKSKGNSSLLMLIFLALATALFVLMALRPAVERSSINLGVPMNAETLTTESTTEATLEETTKDISSSEETSSENTETKSTTEEAEPSTEESTTTN